MDNYYNHIATIYDATRPIPPSISEQVTDCILNLVAATPQTKFLELGIGTGRTGFPIIKRGYAYTGVDISQAMMDVLRGKLQGVPNNLTLIQADASSLMLKDDSFDVVLSVHVMHLLPDLQKALAEIRRVLKPQGFYLHCENLLTKHQKDFDQQWQSILSQHQQAVQTPYSAAKEEVMQILVEQGATIETVTAAEWRLEQTVSELLKAYQSKAYGICWSVPDHVFKEAIAEFSEWCDKHWGLNTILSSEATFAIALVRNW